MILDYFWKARRGARINLPVKFPKFFFHQIFYNKECCSNCHTSQYLGLNAGGRFMFDSRFCPLRVWSFDNIALW